MRGDRDVLARAQLGQTGLVSGLEEAWTQVPSTSRCGGSSDATIVRIDLRDADRSRSRFATKARRPCIRAASFAYAG